MNTDPADGDMTLVSGVGEKYAQVYKINNLTLKGLARVESDPIILYGVFSELEGAILKDRASLIETTGPTVNITSPINGAEFVEGSDLLITVNAEDNVGTMEVSFSIDGLVVFTDTEPPFMYVHNIPLGINSLTLGASATDLSGNVQAAEEVNVMVLYNPDPVVNIYSPFDGAILKGGAKIVIGANIVDTTGVREAEFIVNGEKIITDYLPPYEIAYTIPTSATNLLVHVNATDRLGKTGSDEVNVAVIPDLKTTVVGKVVNSSGVPAVGASLSVNGGISSTTDTSGNFTIAGVPTYKDIIVVASGKETTGIFSGRSNSTAPQMSGATDVGVITLSEKNWAARYDSAGHGGDFINASVIDSNGNLYVTGESVGNGVNGNTFDYATIKYDATGNQLWVARYEGSWDDSPNAIAVDSAGNVYVTGESSRDDSYYGSDDFITIKYDSNGQQLWVARYSGGKDDVANAIAIDATGNVYVTGASYGGELTFATVKYDSNGNQLWAVRKNGDGNAIALDNAGNVYVTGDGYITYKFDTYGNQMWVVNYTGPGDNQDYTNAIAVDNDGNVYVTGAISMIPSYTNYYESGYNIATVKYDPNGNQLWAETYSANPDFAGSGNMARVMVIDSYGNIIVAGARSGSDFSSILKYNPSGNRLWAKQIHGNNGNAIELDAGGNIYVTGQTHDSNPWAYSTAKFDADGLQIWSRQFGAGEAKAIAVDNGGNVYVSGGSIDNSETYHDFITVKYDTDGNQLWVGRYNGSEGSFEDIANAITTDYSGNIYVTGGSSGSYATVKYDPTGNKLWEARYHGAGNSFYDIDSAKAIAVDLTGNVYVTGESIGDGTGNDFATIKYDSNGNRMWVARYDGPGLNNGQQNIDYSIEYAKAIATDSMGNVYVSGESDRDFATIKYDTYGNQLWVARYSGPENKSDSVTAMVIDSVGNVYVTGKSGVLYSSDYVTVKYDTNGNQLWVARYDGGRDDIPRAITIDLSGNIYVTGESHGDSVYEYLPDGRFIYKSTGIDYATVKYDFNGNQLWVARYDKVGIPTKHEYRDYAKAIAVDPSGNIYVTGESDDDYLTLKYDANGNKIWERRYASYYKYTYYSDTLTGAGYDSAKVIALDSAGNIYVTGESYKWRAEIYGFATVKYDPDGNQLWVGEYKGNVNTNSYGKAMAIDSADNVYVTGGCNNGTTGTDFCTMKLPLAGSETFDIVASNANSNINTATKFAEAPKPAAEKTGILAKVVNKIKGWFSKKEAPTLIGQAAPGPVYPPLMSDVSPEVFKPKPPVLTQENILVASLNPTNSPEIKSDLVDPTFAKVEPVMSVQSATATTPAASSGVDPEYTYYNNGNRKTMTDPTGTTTYTYDALNRIKTITNPKNQVTTYTYEGDTRTVTSANGVKTTFNFDPAGQLLSLVNQLETTNISTYGYTYDKVGNRKTITEAAGVNTYAYDNIYRLVQATHPQPANPAEEFDYDPVGNRLPAIVSDTPNYDAGNRLLFDDSFEYKYDANGNRTEKANKTTGEVERYIYDSENRLIKYEKFAAANSASPAVLALYQYDGLGRRTLKNVNGQIMKYVLDGANVLLELNAADQITTRYTNSLWIDDIISMDKDTNADGTLETSYYYHKDGLGSVTKITDSAGAVVQSYTYDSFGNIKEQQDSNFVQPYTYTGRELDSESGMYYYRARYYDAKIGRFLTQDPIGFAGGINFYAYVGGNPVNRRDPWGLWDNGYPTPTTYGPNPNAGNAGDPNGSSSGNAPSQEPLNIPAVVNPVVEALDPYIDPILNNPISDELNKLPPTQPVTGNPVIDSLLDKFGLLGDAWTKIKDWCGVKKK